jgi:hypothetical protein
MVGDVVSVMLKGEEDGGKQKRLSIGKAYANKILRLFKVY